MIKKQNYYNIYSKEHKIDVCAFPPDGYSDFEQIVDTLPFEMNLYKHYLGRKGLVIEKNLIGIDKDKIWVDFLPCKYPVPLFSEKLKLLLQTYTSDIKWVSAKINGNDEQLLYYLPYFERQEDLIDEKFSYDASPCISKLKAINHHVFQLKKGIYYSIYISSTVKKEFEKSGITNVKYEIANSI